MVTTNHLNETGIQMQMTLDGYGRASSLPPMSYDKVDRRWTLNDGETEYALTDDILTAVCEQWLAYYRWQSYDGDFDEELDKLDEAVNDAITVVADEIYHVEAPIVDAMIARGEITEEERWDYLDSVGQACALIDHFGVISHGFMDHGKDGDRFPGTYREIVREEGAGYGQLDLDLLKQEATHNQEV